MKIGFFSWILHSISSTLITYTNCYSVQFLSEGIFVNLSPQLWVSVQVNASIPPIDNNYLSAFRNSLLWTTELTKLTKISPFPFESKIFLQSNIDFIHKWHKKFQNRTSSIADCWKLYQTKIKSINMLQMSSSSDYERQKNNNNSNGGRNSRNKKKGAPFMFFSNILRKKKTLGFEEIREMKERTRSEPSGELFVLTQSLECALTSSSNVSANLAKKLAGTLNGMRWKPHENYEASVLIAIENIIVCKIFIIVRRRVDRQADEQH